MKLSEFIAHVNQIDSLSFRLQSGVIVPVHFHLTELGIINKIFVDCGDVLREESFVSFQLWSTFDDEHRLSPKGLISIIKNVGKRIHLRDSHIEVEYQTDTVGKYSLAFDSGVFILCPKKTDCLDPKSCGIPVVDESSSHSPSTDNKCTPGAGCC